jgi:CheY-like chemotaxis protein
VQKKVLVVEDQADAREMLEVILGDEGYSVITTEDGLAGLELAQRERPDIIITNLNMPNLDGVEMVKRLRQQQDLSDVPIVVLSAIGTDDPQALIKAGVNTVLSKPVEIKMLLETLSQALTQIATRNAS